MYCMCHIFTSILMFFVGHLCMIMLWIKFAVNILTCTHSQTHQHILATPTCISSLTTLEAHSLCHSLTLPLSLLDHNVCWNDEVSDVHTHSFGDILLPLTHKIETLFYMHTL